MNDRKPMSTELNLRTRGLGLVVEGTNLTAVAVHNKFNKLNYQGHEILEAFESLQDEEVVEFVDEFQAKYKIKRSDTMLVIPRSEVDIQFVDFPAEAGASLDEAIEYQLPSYFPGDLEAYDFFHQIIHRGDNLRVMIMATRKEYLGHTFSYLRRYKLKLSGIGLSTLALVNGLAKSDNPRFTQERTIVFHFHRDALEMIAINCGMLATTTLIPLPDEPEFQSDIFMRDLEDAFSRARMDPNDVDTYLWTGSAPEAVDQLLHVELMFPKDTWKDTHGKTIPSQALPGFGAAVTTLKDKVPFAFNYLPEKLRKRHKRLPVMLAALLVPILLISLLVMEYREYSEIADEANMLEQRVEEIKQRAFALSDARTSFEVKQQELDLFLRFQTNQMLVRMLLNLAQELPTHTYLTSMNIKDGNQLTLIGESDNPFEVQRILQNSPYLKEVDASRPTTTTGNGKKRFTYNAVITLEALR